MAASLSDHGKTPTEVAGSPGYLNLQKSEKPRQIFTGILIFLKT
jgi:hypothetical protein